MLVTVSVAKIVAVGIMHLFRTGVPTVTMSISSTFEESNVRGCAGFRMSPIEIR
jgi:hypothetical protein